MLNWNLNQVVCLQGYVFNHYIKLSHIPYLMGEKKRDLRQLNSTISQYIYFHNKQ